VVATGEPLFIEDARRHPVLRESLAVDQLGVVAYAGIPLKASQGETLGTFCVIDRVPRVWTDAQLSILADLAASVMTEIELRATKELEAQARAAEAARVEADAARGRMALLAEVSAVLAEGEGGDAALVQAARLCVPLVADGCAIDVLEEGEPRRVAVAHLDAGEEGRLRTPEWPALLVTSEREAPVAGHLRLTGPEGSSVRLPLTGHGRVLGVATFTTVPPRRMGDIEVQLARDVARRVALAVDNAWLHQESHEAIRLRDRFLSIASHELRTPLTTLRLQTQSLLRGAGERSAAQGQGAPSRGTALGTISAAVASKVRVIARQVERLGHLVDELLDIARLNEGRLAFHLEDVDLGAVVCEVAGRFREVAERGESPLALRGVEARVVGHWDRLRLEQVVTNLLSNALKYGPGAPVALTVTADADTAWLTVRDEGIGIAAKDQERIFERFERAVSEQHYGGFGLGLWIVRELVRGLGGSISVHSAPGAGSAFTVELPRRAARVPGPLLH
jgi:signal transduction histidine kinase